MRDKGMFGTGIQMPGSVYWFCVSLLLLLVVGFNAVLAGSFLAEFVIPALLLGSTAGFFIPYLNTEALIKNSRVFTAFLLVVLLITNTADHILHKPVTFSGLMTIFLSAVVGLYLGRYVRINRFSSQDTSSETEL